MSVALSATARLDERLARLPERVRGSLPDLLEEIGATVVSQTQRRIAEERRSPEGDPWPEWSPRYAPTRHGGQALLVAEGHLAESVQHTVLGHSVEVGSNLVYAATHQFGSEDGTIPARPWLGLSAENEQELDHVIEDWLRTVAA